MLFFFPRGVLDEILNLIESVSEGFPSYFCIRHGNVMRALVIFAFFFEGVNFCTLILAHN